MSDPYPFDNPRRSLFLPFLSGFYDRFAQPVGWVLFRVVIGLMLVVEGWPKILDPMGQIGFLENIGIYPGWLFSPLLAAMQFFGGLMIAAGLLTRPIALANAVMLLTTLWFHVSNPFGDALLTPAGIELLQANVGEYLTVAGQRRLLPDGGGAFLHLVQGKAEFASLFWAAGAALLAAFGGGYYSVDRHLIKKEF